MTRADRLKLGWAVAQALAAANRDFRSVSNRHTTAIDSGRAYPHTELMNVTESNERNPVDTFGFIWTLFPASGVIEVEARSLTAARALAADSVPSGAHVQFSHATTAEEDACEGHPASEFDPMGETVYCDGSCRS